MTKHVSSLDRLVAETLLTSSIRSGGPVPAKQDCYGVKEGSAAPTERPSNSSSSSGTEAERLADMIETHLRRRMAGLREVRESDVCIGQYMRILRSKMGVTLSVIADHLDIPFIKMHRIEQGAQSATIEELYKIFQVYGISITQIASALKK